MSVAIRSATAADAESLALVAQATFLESYAHMIDGTDILAHCASQHSISVYAAWLSKGDVHLWLAVTPTDAPVGYLAMAVPDLPIADIGPDDVEIKRIYVLHRFHRGGVGFRLMSTALDAAREAGKRRALLAVYRGNDPAIAFYTRMGFGPIGTRKFQVGSREYDDLVLARSLWC